MNFFVVEDQSSLSADPSQELEKVSSPAPLMVPVKKVDDVAFVAVRLVVDASVA
jgi:hypothetical protein